MGTAAGCATYEAVLWQADGKATNLAPLLGTDWTNTKAVGINDNGDIIGYGMYNNGTLSGTYSFLLTPSAATADKRGGKSYDVDHQRRDDRRRNDRRSASRI